MSAPCGGKGVKAYANTSRYGRGVGGQIITTQECHPARHTPPIRRKDTQTTDKRYGPQTDAIEALLQRAAQLTDDEAARLADAQKAQLLAVWSAWEAVCTLAVQAGRSDEVDAVLWAAMSAVQVGGVQVGASHFARSAVEAAVETLVVRDLIGQHGFEQEHYDALTAPWAAVIGKAHPDDKDMNQK